MKIFNQVSTKICKNAQVKVVVISFQLYYYSFVGEFLGNRGRENSSTRVVNVFVNWKHGGSEKVGVVVSGTGQHAFRGFELYPRVKNFELDQFQQERTTCIVNQHVFFFGRHRFCIHAKLSCLQKLSLSLSLSLSLVRNFDLFC